MATNFISKQAKTVNVKFSKILVFFLNCLCFSSMCNFKNKMFGLSWLLLKEGHIMIFVL